MEETSSAELLLDSVKFNNDWLDLSLFKGQNKHNLSTRVRTLNLYSSPHLHTSQDSEEVQIKH